MQFTTLFSAVSALAATAYALPTEKVLLKRGTISITPHDTYSSSVGVLGCKVDTNRVAYWPQTVGCDDMCVKVSRKGRSVHLLRVDQSGGAYDISYDAWNELNVGASATADPTMGGGIDATYESVGMEECAHLLHDSDGKLAFTAANSMNFVSSCMTKSGSWVGANYALYNIANSACTLGVDELCALDLAVTNQPQCPSGLGSQVKLTTAPVTNILYGTGSLAVALQ